MLSQRNYMQICHPAAVCLYSNTQPRHLIHQLLQQHHCTIPSRLRQHARRAQPNEKDESNTTSLQYPGSFDRGIENSAVFRVDACQGVRFTYAGIVGNRESCHPDVGPASVVSAESCRFQRVSPVCSSNEARTIRTHFVAEANPSCLPLSDRRDYRRRISILRRVVSGLLRLDKTCWISGHGYDGLGGVNPTTTTWLLQKEHTHNQSILQVKHQI